MMKAQYKSHMGSDLDVVNNARVSFGTDKESTWDENGNLRESDARLIRFLASGLPAGEIDTIVDILAETTDHALIRSSIDDYRTTATHWAPFSHEHIKLVMAAPIPIRTQCFKHKVGFEESEESRRYISSTPEIYVPEFRMAADSAKQGSGGVHPEKRRWLRAYEHHCHTSVEIYKNMIAANVCPEQARLAAGQIALVNWIWTGNLVGFARFYNQRTNLHAQKEARDLAEMVAEIIEPLYPVSWAALTC